MGEIPIAVSRLGDDDSREAQNVRAVKRLLAQPGGSVVIVTPRRAVESASLKRLIAQPNVRHHAWRGFHGGHFDRGRVLYAWPDRQHLNDLWNADADAIVVIEWDVEEIAEWIEDVNPIQLFPGETIDSSPRGDHAQADIQWRRSHPRVSRGHGRRILVGSELERGGQAQGRHDEPARALGLDCRRPGTSEVPGTWDARRRQRHHRRLPEKPERRSTIQRAVVYRTFHFN